MKLTQHKGRYLKAVDLPKPVLLTIRDATNEAMPDGEHKDILWFEEVEQGLALNKINAGIVVKTTGTDDTDKMAGQKIVLYATTTEFKGDMVDCIRVRAPKETQTKTDPPPNIVEEDDIPF